MDQKLILKRVVFNRSNYDTSKYPYNLLWLQHLQQLEFEKPITFLSGENGVGKSTLLEALAINAGSRTMNANGFVSDEYHAVQEFANTLKLQWNYRTNNGLFFRADDFITFIRDTKERREFAQNALDQIKDPNSYERMPYAHTLYDLEQLYPHELDKLSHGQTFLEMFQGRLRPNSLYFLDEPESPLSPQNQLSLLYMMHQQIKQGSQFIISSHSPILMAYPDALILNITDNEISKINYEEVAPVKFMKDFMSDPQKFVHYTLKEDD